MEWIENKIWKQNDYEEYIKYLISQREDKYRNFHKKLTPTKYEILGIRVPMSRKIAKKIGSSDIKSFLNCTKDSYYEEVLIEGFIIASIKEEEFFKKEFERFLPKIDNWAICDGFCNSIQIIRTNPDKYFPYILNLLKSNEPFTIRVGLVTLLSWYVEEKYLKDILKHIDEIESDHYYVNMGEAWLLAEIYTKYPNIAEEYFKVSKINDFTMNKTISKIRDSYRISKEAKEKLLQYRRKK